MEEGSGWGTHVYLWRIHFDMWQNQYNIAKLKKIKKKRKEKEKNYNSKKKRTGQGRTDWFQIRKEYIKAVYCHPTYLTYIQSTS